MKKLLTCLSISLCILFSSIPVSAANPFSDVKTGDWFYSSVQYAVDNGLFEGITPDRFAPKDPMTRAMFVTVLGRMVGVDESSYAGTSFGDVPTGKWFSAYVQWASQKGIVNGTNPGQFSPNAKVTREQMAAMIARYAGSQGVALPDSPTAPPTFKDIGKVSSYAATSLELMRKTGIISGNTTGNFNPQNTATRAEAATIFMRLDQSKGKGYVHNGPTSTAFRWTQTWDNPSDNSQYKHHFSPHMKANEKLPLVLRTYYNSKEYLVGITQEIRSYTEWDEYGSYEISDYYTTSLILLRQDTAGYSLVSRKDVDAYPSTYGLVRVAAYDLGDKSFMFLTQGFGGEATTYDFLLFDNTGLLDFASEEYSLRECKIENGNIYLRNEIWHPEETIYGPWKLVQISGNKMIIPD